MFAAALQMRPRGDAGTNLAVIDRAARAAAGFGAGLLVAPELATTGYAMWADFPRLAEPRDGRIVGALAAGAARHGIAIAAGFPERAGTDVYNAVALATPDGNVHVYRKCHLFGPREKAAFRPGDSHAQIVTISGMRAAMLICYDVEFPEMVRAATLAGAELLVVPTALPRGSAAARVSRSMIPVRAFENHVFAIYADLCGEENGTPYQGGSVIVGPDGEPLARAGATETLLLVEIDPAHYSGMELDPYLNDRRPELYRDLLRN